MSESSEIKGKRELTREAIIGLGEDSFRKNYYTELQEKIAFLERSDSRNRALIKTIPDILLVSDLAGEIVVLSEPGQRHDPVAQAILGSMDVTQQLQEAVREAVIRSDLVTTHFVLTLYDRVRYFEARVHVSALDEVLIIVRDMTERTLLEMKLREMVEIDSLTGLHNRRYFEERLSEFEGKRIRNFAVILIDINGLKEFNDTLGHLAGDEAIKATAQIIDRHFGRIGYVARVGGDEFGVILHGYTQSEIEFKMEQMRGSVNENNKNTDTIKISLSFGYSLNENDIIRTRWMFQEADNNMNENKLLKDNSARSSLVKTLMKTLEAKDFITEGHARRMEYLALRLGEEMRLSQRQLDRIKLLANFHDIGKVGIPDSVLSKPGRLDDDEWKIMKTHSFIGKRIAESSAELRNIARLILLHHERWDGSGYPTGSSGSNIPIECRIMGIVDAYDAMTNDRPYRKAMSHEEAVNKILEGAGTQFDPDIVEKFLQNVTDNG